MWPECMDLGHGGSLDALVLVIRTNICQEQATAMVESHSPPETDPAT